jgi:fumarate hydratase class I
MNCTDFDFFPFNNTENNTLSIQVEKSIEAAFNRLSFTFTKNHLQHLINICLSPDSSENDIYVCSNLLENAEISSQGILPLCQDTGIANIFGWRASSSFSSKGINNAITKAVEKIYTTRNLRFSTNKPLSLFNEIDPQNNLPAYIQIYDQEPVLPDNMNITDDDLRYHFVCCAKGGGSSNKTEFVQGTKANLTPENFRKFLTEKIAKLGTSACPPYTISVVAGGLSPEQNLTVLKLSTSGYYDDIELAKKRLPTDSFRDLEWEQIVLDIANKTGLGAQFGGSALAIDSRVIRLPRHGASCPLSIGVSCSAHRNLEVIVTQKGYYLQKTVESPWDLPGYKEALEAANSKKNTPLIINTNNGIDICLQQLSQLQTGQRLFISGKILVARDAAHARWKALIDQGYSLPSYTKEYPIWYAGPAETPEGYSTGSIGPTTAGRMDSYSDLLLSQGASLIMIAKGNRSNLCKDACKKYGGFYLGTIGGAAALIASKYIQKVSVLDYPELGMEAVRLIEVDKLPAFLLIDNKGNDFYDKTDTN